MQKDYNQFRKRLVCWYKTNKRMLPWRKTDNPYHIWLSEVMLQQTQVNTVIPYYNNFLELFPHMHALCKADEDSLLKAWEGLGYYQRIKNFHKAVCKVVNELNGKLPDDYDDFIQLPGVGSYMAAAVMSLVYNQAYAVVDGNVKRVISRLLKIDNPVNHTTSHKEFQVYADKLLDRHNPAIFNQAMMELGAVICRPSSPNCTVCPVKMICESYADQVVIDYPKRIKKHKIKIKENIAYIPFNWERQIWISKRQNTRFLEGLWEIPLYEYLRKERKKGIPPPLFKVEHIYTHFKEIVYVYPAQKLPIGLDKKSKPILINILDAREYPMTGVSGKIIQSLHAFRKK